MATQLQNTHRLQGQGARDAGQAACALHLRCRPCCLVHRQPGAQAASTRAESEVLGKSRGRTAQVWFCDGYGLQWHP